MQTGLFIERVTRADAGRHTTGFLGRFLLRCRRWFSSYELGSDEKIRRFTGAR